MKAKFITYKLNRDGSAILYFDKGIDTNLEHELVDLKGREVEIGLPRATEDEVKGAGIVEGKRIFYNAVLELCNKWQAEGMEICPTCAGFIPGNQKPGVEMEEPKDIPVQT